MPPDVTPLTFEEHRELGREILRARARLLQLSSMMSDVYGPQSPSASTFQEMTNALEKVCREMQAQAEFDCPGRDAASFYR